MHFRLVNPTAGQVQLLRAEVKLGGPTIFVVISRAEDWPFIIENDSDHAFTVYQMVRACRIQVGDAEDSLTLLGFGPPRRSSE